MTPAGPHWTTYSHAARFTVLVVTMFALIRCATAAPSPQELAKKIESSHGITVTTNPPRPFYDSVKFKSVAANDPGIVQYLRIIDEELSRYSPTLLRASGFKTIAFVQDLNVSGEWCVYSSDVASATLYANIHHATADDWYPRHVLHFEIGHAIDRRLNGFLAKDDPAWLSLNAPDFRYGAGGRAVRENVHRDHSDATPGFFSQYSKSEARQDKAEVFAGLMMEEEKKRLEQQCAHDRVLRAKAAYMQKLIDHYQKPEVAEELQRAWTSLLNLICAVDDTSKLLPLLNATPTLIEQTTWSKRNVLHLAILHRRTHTAESLVTDSTWSVMKIPTADPNAADETGWTALHFAAMSGDFILARAMLDAGADPTVKDRFGGTPLDWAKRTGNAKVLEEFRKATFKKPARPANGRARN